MTAKQFLEWEAYAAVEPFGEWWASKRTASVVQYMANRDRDTKKRPKPYELEDLVIKIEDGPRRTQTWEDHKLVASLLVALHNHPSAGEERTGPQRKKGRK